MDDGVEMRYRGRVTVGSPGRARFHDRDGGLSELIWDALGQAGWLGQFAQVKPIIELVISVPQASGSGAAPNTTPLPGGVRRERERGRVADDGMVWKRYVGPLHARAAGPGVRLVASEWRVEDFNSLEDMLYTVATQAGWLSASGRRQDASEISDADILIRVARRSA
jgi:hypothetical protein